MVSIGDNGAACLSGQREAVSIVGPTTTVHRRGGPIGEWLKGWGHILNWGTQIQLNTYDVRYEMLGYCIPPQYILVSRITKPTKVYKANNSIHLLMVQCVVTDCCSPFRQMHVTCEAMLRVATLSVQGADRETWQPGLNSHSVRNTALTTRVYIYLLFLSLWVY
jgi:hypothetical protein